MPIRSTVKALIIKDNKILLNRCREDRFGDYFSLPGGGQNQCETLHETVVRECLEETGYHVKPIRFAALCEVISTDDHRMYHVFICELIDNRQSISTEKDVAQVGTEWVDIEQVSDAPKTRLFPTAVSDNLREILDGTAPIFLGSDYRSKDV